jgi:hypothetical protein
MPRRTMYFESPILLLSWFQIKCSRLSFSLLSSYGCASIQCRAICSLVANHTPSFRCIYSINSRSAQNRAGFPTSRLCRLTLNIFGSPRQPSSYMISNASLQYSSQSWGYKSARTSTGRRGIEMRRDTYLRINKSRIHRILHIINIERMRNDQ